MSLTVQDLHKRYAPSRGAPVVALAGIDLEVADGELMVVVGPSGSGKSTLLRCVAGLEDPEAGRVDVGGRNVTRAAPGDRDVAMVFQDYALYPHLTVEANIAFGLRARRTSTKDITGKVGRAAELLALGGVLSRRPGELSGGERQRVALARAMVREPKVFLLDEPLSNLDAELRAQTRAEIRSLQRSLGTTTLYVTHDQVEAMTMGDRLAVLRAGRVEQVGAPMELYDRPANAFVARFLGHPAMNLFRSDGSVVGVRPERVALVTPGAGRLDGVVEAVETIGHEAIVHVRVGEDRLLVRCEVGRVPQRGAAIGLSFSDSDLHHFEDFEGPALR